MHEPDAIDQRLAALAAAVRAGQIVERHWDFFRVTYFPGMTDNEASDALFAWAGRNGVRATLHQSLETSSHVTHVRLSAKN